MLSVVKLSPAVTAPTITNTSSATTSPRLRPTEPDRIFCIPDFSVFRDAPFPAGDGASPEEGGPTRSPVVTGSLTRRFLS
ncbi:hypothetical protein GCM10017690_00310 [Microbacterium terregens]